MNEMEAELDYIQLEEDHIEALAGLCHYCPLCFHQLSLRSMPGLGEEHWYCRGCGTEWEVTALIEALNYEEVRDGN